MRANPPRCRLDEDWEETQRKTIEFIVKTANENKAELFIVGDIFDTPNVPNRIVTMLASELSKMKNYVYFLAGNHDLPQHSMENINNSSIGILMQFAWLGTSIQPIPSTLYAYNNFNEEIKSHQSGILFTHRLVFKDKKSTPPFGDNITAADLLSEYPWANWIFTGDMHLAFHYEKAGRHVVNPGCIIRQTADMADYQPMLYLVNIEKETVKAIEIPDNAEMVTDLYLRAEEERDNRITAFVEGIKRSETISLSITDNIKKAIKKNKKLLNESIINMIDLLISEVI